MMAMIALFVFICVLIYVMLYYLPIVTTILHDDNRIEFLYPDRRGASSFTEPKKFILNIKLNNFGYLEVKYKEYSYFERKNQLLVAQVSPYEVFYLKHFFLLKRGFNSLIVRPQIG